jgi:hypothetical protein
MLIGHPTSCRKSPSRVFRHSSSLLLAVLVNTRTRDLLDLVNLQTLTPAAKRFLLCPTDQTRYNSATRDAPVALRLYDNSRVWIASSPTSVSKLNFRRNVKRAAAVAHPHNP